MKYRKEKHYRFIDVNPDVSRDTLLAVFGTSLIALIGFIILVIGLFFPEIGLKFIS